MCSQATQASAVVSADDASKTRLASAALSLSHRRRIQSQWSCARHTATRADSGNGQFHQHVFPSQMERDESLDVFLTNHGDDVDHDRFINVSRYARLLNVLDLYVDLPSDRASSASLSSSLSSTETSFASDHSSSDSPPKFGTTGDDSRNLHRDFASRMHRESIAASRQRSVAFTSDDDSSIFFVADALSASLPVVVDDGGGSDSHSRNGGDDGVSLHSRVASSLVQRAYASESHSINGEIPFSAILTVADACIDIIRNETNCRQRSISSPSVQSRLARRLSDWLSYSGNCTDRNSLPLNLRARMRLESARRLKTGHFDSNRKAMQLHASLAWTTQMFLNSTSWHLFSGDGEKSPTTNQPHPAWFTIPSAPTQSNMVNDNHIGAGMANPDSVFEAVSEHSKPDAARAKTNAPFHRMPAAAQMTIARDFVRADISAQKSALHSSDADDEVTSARSYQPSHDVDFDRDGNIAYHFMSPPFGRYSNQRIQLVENVALAKLTNRTLVQIYSCRLYIFQFTDLHLHTYSLSPESRIVVHHCQVLCDQTAFVSSCSALLPFIIDVPHLERFMRSADVVGSNSTSASTRTSGLRSGSGLKMAVLSDCDRQLRPALGCDSNPYVHHINMPTIPSCIDRI
jgi:hypothetical protein